MNRALQASLIFVGVFAAVGLQAWWLRQRTQRRLYAATEEMAAFRSGGPPYEYLAPQYTTLQKRVYVASHAVSIALLVTGAALELSDTAPRLGFGLVMAAVATVVIRISTLRIVSRHATQRMVTEGDDNPG